MGMEQLGLTLKRGDRLKFFEEEKDQITEGLFIGNSVNGDFVVVPLSENQSQPSVGALLNGQCLFKGEVIAFTSKILEVIDHPVTLWRIHLPTEVKKYDLRDSKRIQCSVSASIDALQNGLVLTGIIQSVSKSGARGIFQSADGAESPFEMDETVTLRCEFPGIPGEQATPSKIIDVFKAKKGWSIGIRFMESAWWVPPYH